MTRFFHSKTTNLILIIVTLLLLRLVGHQESNIIAIKTEMIASFILLIAVLVTNLASSLLCRVSTIDILILLFYVILLIQSASRGFLNDFTITTLFFTFYILLKVFFFNRLQEIVPLLLLVIIILFVAELVVIEHSHYRIEYTRVGSFRNHTSLALFLAIAAPLSINAIKSNIIRYLYITFIVCVILFYSRTAFLSLIFSTTIYFWIKLNFRKKLVLLLPLLIIGLYLFNSDLRSVEGRLLIWKIGFSSICLENLLFGRGQDFVFNHYLKLQMSYFSIPRPISEQLMAGQVRTVLNEYLRVLIEYGFVGLSIVISYIALCYKTLLSKLKANNNNKYFISFTTLICASTSSYPTSSVATAILIIIILVNISSQSATGTLDTKRIDTRHIRTLIVAALVMILSYTITIQFALRNWLELNEKQLERYNEVEFIKRADRIVKTLSRYPSILNDYSKALFEISLFELSIKNAVTSSEVSTSLSTYLMLAAAYEKVGDYNNAELFYLKSCNMVPKLITPKFLLFNFYKEKGDMNKALVQAKYINEYPIKIESKETNDIKQYIHNYLNKKYEN